MKEPQHIPHQPQWGGHVSTQSYALGYVASLFLTLAAFLIVGQKLLSGWLLGVTLFALALAQSWIQLAYYFHLGKNLSLAGVSLPSISCSSSSLSSSSVLF